MALHSAIRWNKPQGEIEMLILEHGVDTMDDAGNYPLHIASQNGHAHLVKLLLTRKANPNVQNVNGQTPLHMAVGYDLDDVIALLNGAGANGEMLNHAGFPAKYGIDGDLLQREALQAFRSAKKSEAFLQALSTIQLVGGVDVAKVAKLGLDKKRSCAAEWTTDVQEQFSAAVLSLNANKAPGTTPAPAPATASTSAAIAAVAPVAVAPPASRPMLAQMRLSSNRPAVPKPVPISIAPPMLLTKGTPLTAAELIKPTPAPVGKPLSPAQARLSPSGKPKPSARRQRTPPPHPPGKVPTK